MKKLYAEGKLAYAAWNKGKKNCFGEEARRKMGAHAKGKKRSEEIKRKISETRIKKGLSKGVNNPMSKEENVKNWLKACCANPNKSEKILGEILQQLAPNEYRFNDGWLIIGGKVPDYPNCNGKKKLIELFGDYWHKDENPTERINYFKQFGYDTLIIWESELFNDSTISKIKEFQNK